MVDFTLHSTNLSRLNPAAITILLISLFLPRPAEAKKVKYSDGTVIYTLDTSTKTASVTGVEKGSSSRKVNILDYILNIDDGLSYKVTSIGKEAFLGSFLENITLPSTIQTIGSRAFETCSLKKLELPGSLTTIGAYAFCDAFYSKTPVDLVLPSGLTTIRGFAFNGCSIRSVRFNKKLTTLGEYSFAKTDLIEVEVPSTVTTLGNGVFAGCESLVTATLKGTRSDIPYQFFDGCSALTTVNLPSGLISIGTWAFSECPSLKTIIFPSSLKSIGELAFYKSGLTSVNFPNGIQTLGDHAFSYITTLTDVTIPASVTTIADYCFEGSSSIMKVTVLNPGPCKLGTCGFDGATYSNSILTVPAGSEEAYRNDREWSCFKSLYDFQTGVSTIRTEPVSAARRKIITPGGIKIEVREGATIRRYDMQGNVRP